MKEYEGQSIYNYGALVLRKYPHFMQKCDNLPVSDWNTVRKLQMKYYVFTNERRILIHNSHKYENNSHSYSCKSLEATFDMQIERMMKNNHYYLTRERLNATVRKLKLGYLSIFAQH